MHPEINNNHISYAEKVLFGKQRVFDTQRKDFIKNLDTVDLHAVPGSGKTTSLLAKLLILEKFLPFRDGSGILILSHTNSAVDEIKGKIGKECPLLQSYPNYLGTIQSFIDNFLAIPFIASKLGTRISSVDTAYYQRMLYSKYKKIEWLDEYDRVGRFFWGRNNSRAEQESGGNAQSKRRILESLNQKDVQRLYYDFTDETIRNIETNAVILRDATSPKYQGLKRVIIDTLKEGVISYDYAYQIAISYINAFPKIKKILQLRFKYVFVDEMQDMDQTQSFLLDLLFHKKMVKNHVFQRIGDRNQAIYAGKIELEETWIEREKRLNITGSKRTSAAIAKIVTPFASVVPVEIRGENLESTRFGIKPKLILYQADRIQEVIPKFASIIKGLQDSGKIPSSDQNPVFKTIGWRKESNSEKRGINSYFPAFEASSPKSTASKDKLIQYLKSTGDTNSFKVAKRNISDGIADLLQRAKIPHPDGKWLTASRFSTLLRDSHPELYEEYKMRIFEWSFQVVKGEGTGIKQSIIDYALTLIPNFIPGWTQFPQEMTTFLSDEVVITDPATSEGSGSVNLFVQDDIEIDVGTVHSAKGETHCATLYVETHFQNDARNGPPVSYESQRLINNLAGAEIVGTTLKNKLKSARMVYVGFSRPTHLLCFAACREHVADERIENLESAGWEIVLLGEPETSN